MIKLKDTAALNKSVSTNILNPKIKMVQQK